MGLEDRIKEELVKLKGDIERNKKHIAGLHIAIDADERILRILREILGPSAETSIVSKKKENLYKRAPLKVIIMDYARTHLNEVINSDDIERHVVRTWGHPLGKGTLSTTLYQLVKDGFLKRTDGKKKFIYVIPRKVSEKEEVLFKTPIGNKIDSKGAVLEVLRSNPNEAMRANQIKKAIERKFPSLHVSRDVIWFQLNKALVPAGLIRKVSWGIYQYELARKELREEDCFAVGGD